MLPLVLSASLRRRAATAISVPRGCSDMVIALTQKAELDHIHFKPIAILTEEKLEQAKRMWLDYFTLILQSQKAAEDTLAGRTLPRACCRQTDVITSWLRLMNRVSG
jgi:hypothetical protein